MEHWLTNVVERWCFRPLGVLPKVDAIHVVIGTFSSTSWSVLAEDRDGFALELLLPAPEVLPLLEPALVLTDELLVPDDILLTEIMELGRRAVFTSV